MSEEHVDAAAGLSERIIDFSRKARLGETSMDDWRQRIEDLLAAQPDLAGQYDIVSVRPPTGAAGSSSGTLFVEARGRHDAVARHFVLRFAPAEKLFHVYDLDGQIRIQRGVAEDGVPIASQLCEDIDGRYLAAPGYLMERASGEAAPGAWFAQGVIADAMPAERRAMVFSFVHSLAQIHSVDWRRRGLSFLLARSNGKDLIERETNWYWDAIQWAGDTDSMARFSAVRDWLITHQPPVERAVLCHGDANFTNYLFEDNAVSAVIDWEMAFIGTPECDISYALVGMGALTDAFPDGVPSREEIIAEYERVSGTRLANLPYYQLFSLYRIVLIHYLGARAFPDEFRAAFASYLDSLVARLWTAAKEVGAI